MHNFVHEMLHNGPAARRIEALWQVRVSPTLAILKLTSFSPGVRGPIDPRSSVCERYELLVGWFCSALTEYTSQTWIVSKWPVKVIGELWI